MASPRLYYCIQTCQESPPESAPTIPDITVVEERFNKRFRASPDYVRLVSSTGEIVSAVGEAVTEGRRLAVTSGGHCLEGFVSDPAVRVIIDISPMKRIYYDLERRAAVVEAAPPWAKRSARWPRRGES